MGRGWMLWTYRTVLKQTAGGGGVVHINVIFAERAKLLHGIIGPNDYAANRNIRVAIFDDESTPLDIAGYLMLSSVVDNFKFSFPTDDLSAQASSDGAKANIQYELGGGQTIKAFTDALAQNEELTFTIHCLIKTTKPTITTTGSTGTVTNTEVYNKVI